MILVFFDILVYTICILLFFLLFLSKNFSYEYNHQIKATGVVKSLQTA